MGEKAVVKKEKEMTFTEVLKLKGTIARFEEVLGKGAASFIASLFTIWTEDKKLQECDVTSILSAAKQAAIMNLPILKQLGYAYVIPYKDWRSGKTVATFQLGYKGLLQLAMRSGVFKNLNAVEIYEGELRSRNRITGEIELEETAGTTGAVVGYAAYMELTNGFKKMYYMTRSEVEAHAQKYSQSYVYDLKNNKKTSVWSTNFDAMAKKTVMKLLLSKYAPTSIEMQGKDLVSAMQADQAAITPEGEYVYVDNGGEMKPSRDNFNEFAPETIDAETGEVKQEEIEVPFD